MQDETYEGKRNLDILRTQHEATKYEHEKDMQDIKDRLNKEIQDLLLEN